MIVKVREKVCNNCAYFKDSNSHLTMTLDNMIAHHYLHPCHAELAPISGSTNSGVEQLKSHCESTGKPFKLCRGLIMALEEFSKETDKDLVRYAEKYIQQLKEHDENAKLILKSNEELNGY